MKNSWLLFKLSLLVVGTIMLMSCETFSPLGVMDNTEKTSDLGYRHSENNRIAFSSFGSSNNFESGIFIMDINGSNLTNLTAELGNCNQPYFSPDGEKIVFVCQDEIFLMNFDGNNKYQLTNDGNINYKSFPIFSPDGSKIAFFATTGDYTKKLDVYLMNSDGSNLRNLTHQYGENLYPQFSPDGLSLAYWSGLTTDQGDYYTDIFTIDVGGNVCTNLTVNNGSSLFPCYSPDGSKIVFIAWRDGDQDYSLYIMNADGSEQRKIFGSERMISFPQFTPDGQIIVFWYYTSELRQGDTDICTINTDGTNFKNLTNSAYRDIAAVVSADGSKIVFESNRDGNDEIYIMNIDGSNQERLTKRPNMTDHQPTLQFHY